MYYLRQFYPPNQTENSELLVLELKKTNKFIERLVTFVANTCQLLAIFSESDSLATVDFDS